MKEKTNRGHFSGAQAKPTRTKKKSESKKTDAARLTLSGTDKLQTQVTEVLRFLFLMGQQSNTRVIVVENWGITLQECTYGIVYRVLAVKKAPSKSDVVPPPTCYFGRPKFRAESFQETGKHVFPLFQNRCKYKLVQTQPGEDPQETPVSTTQLLTILSNSFLSHATKTKTRNSTQCRVTMRARHP